MARGRSSAAQKENVGYVAPGTVGISIHSQALLRADTKILFGYARVSTGDQDLTIQREALIEAGVNPDLIFAETASGTKRDGRKELLRLLQIASKALSR